MGGSRSFGLRFPNTEQRDPILAMLALVGVLTLLFALLQAASELSAGAGLLQVVFDFLLLGLPGFVLLGTILWLPRSIIEPRYYHRVFAWLVAGVLIMFGFLVLRELHPGVSADWAVGTQGLAISIGMIGGVLIGIHETQARVREEQLEERTRELEALAADLAEREETLEEQNERLEAFADLVSHDLRNPLNVAEGRIELAKETGEPHHLDATADALERMEEMIEEMLALAREGNSVSDLESVDLRAIAATSWEAVATAEADLEVRAEPRIRASPEGLKHMFENLFRNAIEHGRDDATIEVGVMDDGFFIADDGPGIPPEERDSIFERGTSSKAEGTGLGLAIVAEIVAGHGWAIEVTESAAGGTRFEVSDVEFVS